MKNAPFIVEFEIIAPTCKEEKVGGKYILDSEGEYQYWGESFVRSLKLLTLLDHPAHYHPSKINMNGKNYHIPIDREKNYMPTFHPDTHKYIVK